MIGTLTMPTLEYARLKVGKDNIVVGYSIDRTKLYNTNNRFYGNRWTAYLNVERPKSQNTMCMLFSAFESFVMNQLKITRDDLLSSDIWNQTHLVIKFKGE